MSSYVLFERYPSISIEVIL